MELLGRAIINCITVVMGSILILLVINAFLFVGMLWFRTMDLVFVGKYSTCSTESIAGYVFFGDRAACEFVYPRFK